MNALRYLAWAALYFVAFDGFSFRQLSWGGLGLGNGSLSWFGILQLAYAAVSVIAAVPALMIIYRLRTSPFGVPLLLVLLLPIWALTNSLITAFIGGAINPALIVSNLIAFKNIYVAFPIVVLLNGARGLSIGINAFRIASLAASLSALAILILGVPSDVLRMTTSTDATRFFRVIYPSGLLVAAGWIYFLSAHYVRGGWRNLVFSLVCLSATLIQLHRSVILGVVLVAILMAAGFIRRPKSLLRYQTITYTVFTILVGLFGIFYALPKLPVIQTYFSSSAAQVASASSSFRMQLLENSVEYMITKTFGLGVGMHGVPVEDFGRYIETAFNAGPTFDSTYANIVIVYGVPGIAVFSVAFFGVYRLAQLLSSFRGIFNRVYGMFLSLFAAYIAVLGFGSDWLFLHSSTAVVFFAVIFAFFRVKGEVGRQ